MTRRSCWVALGLVAVVAAGAEAKPRKYSWEIYPFIGARSHDDVLSLSTDNIAGVRLGYNLTRRWEIEAGYSTDPNNGGDPILPDQDIETFDVNVVLNLNTGADQHETHGRWISGDRWIPFLTAGFGNFTADNDFTGGSREARTFNVGVGTRIMTHDIVGIRFDLRHESSLDEGDFPDSFSNLVGTVGASFIVGGPTPRDSDSDGVIDEMDECPGTPLGCWVDEVGCPRDSDGDGVCDGVDRCPNTPKGCPVDANGCPVDEDGDGVCDALDDCPGTPAGCWVDERGCPKDSDGDGVCDGVDKCPDTPAGCKVDATGCPLDEDGDGVCDGVDQCPGTPRGTKVDERGCPVEVVKLVLANVHFEFGRSTIQAFYRPVLDEVAEALLANEWRSLEIELRGHTDAIDTVEYNYRLGQARADAVKDYLVGKGVAPARLVTKSFSELEPVAPNTRPDGSDDPEGRAMNRRVEMVPTTAVQPGSIRELKVLVRPVMFTGGSAELSAGGRSYLDEVANAFGGEQFGDVRFRVVGGGRQGQAQAEAVAAYLAGKGIARDRITVASGGRAGAVDVVPE